MSEPRVRFHQLTKRYAGVLALDQVGFDVAPGSIHALVGENGAGKSTLVKILAGAVQPDSGSITLDGQTARLANTLDARHLGISIVYQEFNLVGELDVAENIFLGRWPRARLTGAINFKQLHDEARRLLETLNINLSTNAKVTGLSVAQQQMVEIAKAMSMKSRVLVLDEPSAVLTRHELTTLFRLIRQAQERGVSVIYISHRLEEIFELADTVSVLRDGKHISTNPIANVQRNILITEMVGRPIDQEFPPRTPNLGGTLLKCENVSVPNRFQNLSFSVSAGEVFGLTGLVGAGRTSVARALFGALRVSDGSIHLGDKPAHFRHPRAAIRAGVAMVPEDRKSLGLLLQRSIRENITLAYPKTVSRAGFLQKKRERGLVAGIMNNLRIRATDSEMLVKNLSGGNQQKALLARWVYRPQRLIILDEPTRGVDVGAKYEIYRVINMLAERGIAIIMISSELPEVIGMCDRIGVMHEGRLMSILPNSKHEVTQEQIMRLASGEVAA